VAHYSPKKFTVPGRSLCIEKNPDTQSLLFADQFINLRLVAEKAKLSRSMVSKIFNGYRDPSIHSAQMIASALCMSMDDFWHALKEHRLKRDRYIPPQESTISSVAQ
jgi:transcriptional regulator with XRE-family HTH domain